MYSLLIVDDEPLVQVGIKSMLNWKKFDIEIVGIAMNGKSAFELIEQYSPDIVITDIKMPVMSGLDLIRNCRERFGQKAPSFIILTSYEDFHMAKEALQYQVCDYLVKLELNADSLKQSIERVIAQKEKERLASDSTSHASSVDIRSFYDKFFIKLLNNLFESKEQFAIQSKNLQIDFNTKPFLCAHMKIVSHLDESLPVEKQMSLYSSTLQMLREIIVKYIPSHVISLDLHHCAILFSPGGETSMEELCSIIQNVSSTLHKYYNVSLRVGIGQKVMTPQDISDSYQSARQAYASTTDETPIVTIEDAASVTASKNIFNISVFRDELVKAFEEFDADSLHETLTGIIELFSAHPNHYIQALDGACNILYLSISILPDGESLVSQIFEHDSDSYRSLYKQNNMGQIVEWLTHFRDSLCEIFRERRKDHKNYIVTNVKKYIAAHVREHLTLNDVANSFSISPNYLSQLFKKYNDMGFNEYVTYLKIQEAKKLLAEGNYKIYEIADMLSFESAFYFSKVFKKVEGISPTDHQNTKLI